MAAGTTILLTSEYPLKALYKTTADYCLLSLVIELRRTGIGSVRTQTFSCDPQKPNPELVRLAPKTWTQLAGLFLL